MENEKEALAISEYLHSLDVTQPLAYYMARGLSIELARVAAVAAQPSMHLTAFGARLAWLFFGFILVLAMVLIIIGGR